MKNPKNSLAILAAAIGLVPLFAFWIYVTQLPRETRLSNDGPSSIRVTGHPGGGPFDQTASDEPYVGCPASVPTSPWNDRAYTYAGSAQYFIHNEEYSLLWCSMLAGSSTLPTIHEAHQLWLLIEAAESGLEYPVSGQIVEVEFEVGQTTQLTPILLDIVRRPSLFRDLEGYSRVVVSDRNWGKLNLNLDGTWVSDDYPVNTLPVPVVETKLYSNDVLSTFSTTAHMVSLKDYGTLDIAMDQFDEPLQQYQQVYYSLIAYQHFQLTYRDDMVYMTYLAQLPGGEYNMILVPMAEYIASWEPTQPSE